jgi:short-subunit dehydrogenase
MSCGIGPRAEFRSAAITGASSGLGAAFSAVLPSDTNLLLTARNEKALRAVAGKVRREGRRIDIVAADLSTSKGREAVIDACEDLEIDLLINNAGMGTYGPFLETDEHAIEATITVNLLAPVVLARRLLPGMIERARLAGRRAGIINVSSGAAFVPVPTMAVYGASKVFDLSFSEAIAAELGGEPIDVLALCPGPTRTQFGARAGFEQGNLPGAAAPERVARAAMKALGRRRTLITGVIGPLTFGPAAVARNLFSEAFSWLSSPSRQAGK